MFEYDKLLTVVDQNQQRVLRGGSWINNGRNLRSAYRNANTPDNRNNNIGFRLAGAYGQISGTIKGQITRFTPSQSLKIVDWRNQDPGHGSRPGRVWFDGCRPRYSILSKACLWVAFFYFLGGFLG